MPRTDTLLADPQLAAAGERLGRGLVKGAVQRVQQRIRDGEVAPPDAVDAVLASLPTTAGSLRPVLNATGVLVHTNLGRAPLSAAAVEAVVAASGTTDVELDLGTGRRGPRGEAAIAALLAAVPAAEAAIVVNNCAAALALVATALGAGRELVLARGEMVEIGDGFRIPELLGATGARLREVGTTNRVTLADYRGALGPDTGAVLKVHPSNFVVRGFTRAVEVGELAGALAGTGIPLVADVGSGLLRPHPLLPEEPDLQSTLAAGADLVLASGDKLLGGPQAGPGARAGGTGAAAAPAPALPRPAGGQDDPRRAGGHLRGPLPPVQEMLVADLEGLRERARPRRTVRRGRHRGGRRRRGRPGRRGRAPEHPLPSAAVSLPASFAEPLRRGRRRSSVRRGRRTLLNLRSVPPSSDEALAAAVLERARA